MRHLIGSKRSFDAEVNTRTPARLKAELVESGQSPLKDGPDYPNRQKIRMLA